jgi:hypothetical protein
MTMFETTIVVEGIAIDVPIACPSLVPVFAVDTARVDVSTPVRHNPARTLRAFNVGRDVGRARVTDVWRAEHARGGFWCRVDDGSAVHSDRLQSRFFPVLAALAARDA